MVDVNVDVNVLCIGYVINDVEEEEEDDEECSFCFIYTYTIVTLLYACLLACL